MIKKFLKEFKDFAVKGSVINLAVGVMIGAAFQSVVTSLTTNILSPVVGLLTRQNFDSLHIAVYDATINYGAFITSVVNFIIMALVVFLLVKFINGLQTIGKHKTQEVPATERKCPFCATSIDINATRCPACTSMLEQAERKEDLVG